MTARLLFVIGVKPSPGFSSQVAAHDQALLNRTRAKTRVFEKRAVKRLGGGEVNVVADQVHELERAHAKITRLLHDSIDGLHRGTAVAENAQSFIIKWPRDAVDDKSRCIL